jgi:hypothetical protein
MEKAIAEFQKYVATYTDQPGYRDYADITVIRDMVYGLGIAFDKERFYGPDGFERIKKIFVDVLPVIQFEDVHAGQMMCKTCGQWMRPGAGHACPGLRGMRESAKGAATE